MAGRQRGETEKRVGPETHKKAKRTGQGRKWNALKWTDTKTCGRWKTSKSADTQTDIQTESHKKRVRKKYIYTIDGKQTERHSLHVMP